MASIGVQNQNFVLFLAVIKEYLITHSPASLYLYQKTVLDDKKLMTLSNKAMTCRALKAIIENVVSALEYYTKV